MSADMSSLSTGSTGISPKKGKLDWFDMAVVSVLWPGGMVKNLNHKSKVPSFICLVSTQHCLHMFLFFIYLRMTYTLVKELAAYFSMARPINLVPSFLLVFLGAWVSLPSSQLPVCVCVLGLGEESPLICPFFQCRFKVFV